jgi:DNA primase
VRVIDFADVKSRHRLADVARRSGIDAGRTGRVMISCPTPAHLDSTPSAQLDLDRDRYHCFGCGAGGDVIDWVRDIEQVDTATAVAILESRQPINAVFTSRIPSQTRSSRRPDPPRLDRTSPDRIAEANQQAWEYYSYKVLHERGVDYLAGRGIDVRPLEAEAAESAVGHTPSARTRIDGLVHHLGRRGFSESEMIDAGLATRLADGCVIDFFRDRIIMPVLDAAGTVTGLVGRDVSGTSGVKYLNPPTTAIYRKSGSLYQPTRPVLPDGAVVVCEGPLDALAIAAHAASAGLSKRFAPVAACGRILSDLQIETILAIHPRAPVLAADGDPPGRQANLDWARRMLARGRESVITEWPDGYDPASWLAQRGPAGLAAVTRRGCLDDHTGTLRPRHCGAPLTEADFPDRDAFHRPGRAELLSAVAQATAHLPPAGRRRYLSAAASAFTPPGGIARGLACDPTGASHFQSPTPERIDL